MRVADRLRLYRNERHRQSGVVSNARAGDRSWRSLCAYARGVWRNGGNRCAFAEIDRPRKLVLLLPHGVHFHLADRLCAHARHEKSRGAGLAGACRCVPMRMPSASRRRRREQASLRSPLAETRHKKIDERADLGREMARLGVDQGDRVGLRPELVEHGLQSARLQRVVDVIIMGLRNAEAGANSVTQGRAVGESHVALWRHGALGAVADEPPGAGQSRVAHREADAIVVFKVLRLPGSAMPREIAGRADDAELSLRQPPGDQGRIFQRAEPEADVDTLLDEIDIAIGEAEREPEIGILRLELAEQGNDLDAAEGGGHVDAQSADRLQARVLQHEFGFVEICQDLTTALVEGGAVFGQADATRGTCKEPHAKLLLEPADRIARAGLCDAEISGGANETAPLRNLHENLESS